MDKEKIAKSGQEQAVAAWINYLNQIRLNRFASALEKEHNNLSNALNSLDDALDTIGADIVNNGKGRGGEKGMHGFIAEAAECGIGNARKIIEGRTPDIVWIDDNGPSDLLEGTQFIQMKFSRDHLSLQAISNHLKQYPDYLDKGGVYKIPLEQYDRIKWLLSIPENEANKMPTQTGEFSLK